MKKNVFLLLAAVVMCAIPMRAQLAAETNEEGDSIVISYAPNKFADNWELSIAGGASVLFDGIGYTPKTQYKRNKYFYDCVGGVGEISATKWFNPYVAARLGWLSGYVPYTNASNFSSKGLPNTWHNYVHVDMLWDWTTQFGGYRPERIYNLVPYLHVGIIGNPGGNIMVGGGLGFLNRFKVHEHWLINIDLRATSTSSRKFGVQTGVAILPEVLVGISYRFNKVGWNKKIRNPYNEELQELRQANRQLEHDLAHLGQENNRLANNKQELEQQNQNLIVRVKEVEERGEGIQDTMQMTVFYAISSTELSNYEKEHLRMYLRVITQNDPKASHRYKVIGSADAGTGTREVNERIAAQRAENIKKALMENGIPENQIDVTTAIVSEGDPRMQRASHVIIYPKSR